MEDAAETITNLGIGTEVADSAKTDPAKSNAPSILRNQPLQPVTLEPVAQRTPRHPQPASGPAGPRRDLAVSAGREGALQEGVELSLW